MTEFLGEFETPWALLLLALLPLYAWLRGGRSRSSALLYPDAALLTPVSRRRSATRSSRASRKASAWD